MNAASMQSINDQQNDLDHIRLLQAADVEHARAQRVESLRWAVALGLSVLGLAAILIPELRMAATVGGIVAAGVTEAVWPRLTKKLTQRAVLIQEKFDTSLFRLDWNRDLGSPVPLVHIANAAGRYRKNEDKKNWYLDVRGIPSPIAETLCQRENLIWDADQREEWAWRLVSGLTLWFVVGMGISFAAEWYVWQLCAWFIAPTLPVATLVFRSLLQQRSVARTKIALRERIDEALHGLTPDNVTEQKLDDLRGALRPRQDKIFHSRLDSARVPERFYNHVRARYEINHEVEADHFRSIWVQVP